MIKINGLINICFYFLQFKSSLIKSYKYGLNSSIGRGSLYKIELKHVELTSSTII